MVDPTPPVIIPEDPAGDGSTTHTDPTLGVCTDPTGTHRPEVILPTTSASETPVGASVLAGIITMTVQAWLNNAPASSTTVPTARTSGSGDPPLELPLSGKYTYMDQLLQLEAVSSQPKHPPPFPVSGFLHGTPSSIMASPPPSHFWALTSTHSEGKAGPLDEQKCSLQTGAPGTDRLPQPCGSRGQPRQIVCQVYDRGHETPSTEGPTNLLGCQLQGRHSVVASVRGVLNGVSILPPYAPIVTWYRTPQAPGVVGHYPLLWGMVPGGLAGLVDGGLYSSQGTPPHRDCCSNLGQPLEGKAGPFRV
uniref:Uncharacterized protein n=1 Tax=Amphimedon queenslandica TaxID=400682 RepID=A0A1X7USI2_AMPQE